MEEKVIEILMNISKASMIAVKTEGQTHIMIEGGIQDLAHLQGNLVETMTEMLLDVLGREGKEMVKRNIMSITESAIENKYRELVKEEKI